MIRFEEFYESYIKVKSEYKDAGGRVYTKSNGKHSSEFEKDNIIKFEMRAGGYVITNNDEVIYNRDSYERGEGIPKVLEDIIAGMTVNQQREEIRRNFAKVIKYYKTHK